MHYINYIQTANENRHLQTSVSETNLNHMETGIQHFHVSPKEGV